ncbi:PAS domain S-box protein [Winogradskyella sp.]|jgi:PAS domain S-box-containing protein|uniref:sensor histidine kinase n=1 Tax=Winogradskyella sp. TaxID=1883156 RepID=UPI0025FFAF56|nr:sensor histidine kinase [Winogradskyella sp.]MCT4630688.1 PAS domain S-box protein [Winogradskyella sp.]
MKASRTNQNFSNANDVLNRVFSHTYNGIAVVSMDGNWLKMNEAVSDIFGYTKTELFNMDINNIVFIEDLGVHETKFEKLINGTIDKYRVKQRYFHKNGNVIWVLIYVTLVYFKEGRPHMIWQFTDVTKRQKNQDKLKTMLSVAKEQNDRLTSFANIVTHNLRSHSGNLSTLTEFLEEDFTNITSNENYTLLRQAIDNLQETVSHLTEVAKIKEIEPSKLQTLNLYEFVEKAMYNIIAMAQNSNALIYNHINEAHNIKGVPAYLDSIILNFLTNAIKYKSEKRTLVIELTSHVEEKYIVLRIKDNGLGIDLEKFGDKLFQMYKTFHYNEDAIGIGLFITKNHIESLGGKVTVDSEVDVGTAFSIYLRKA